MQQKLTAHRYHYSFQKRLFDITLSLPGFIFFSPVLVAIAIIITISSRGPVFFVQERVGKDGKTFKIIMFRTMYKGAQKDQVKYSHLNEADGPVFKIKDDPRFVGVGKYLTRSGLDELPQFVNVIKGEMSLVGPRPLPVAEAKKLTKKDKVRELIKPGMTSLWVVEGAHSLSFKKWMKLDRTYVQKASLLEDILILIKTVSRLPKLLLE